MTSTETKTSGAWLCLLLLGWALAGSWIGHAGLTLCDGGECYAPTPDDDGRGLALFPNAVDERDVCLACHLLRCLQTASAPATAAIGLLVVLEGLPPGVARVAEHPAGVTGSARAPPTA